MDITSITAAYNGLKFIKDSLDIAIVYKTENETRERINEALKQVWAVQETLFKVQREMFQLQKENEKLLQQLKVQKDWETQKSQYQLEQTTRGATVFAFTGTPRYYACPSCFNKEKIEILQDEHDPFGNFQCPGCKTNYPIGPLMRLNLEIEC